MRWVSKVLITVSSDKKLRNKQLYSCPRFLFGMWGVSACHSINDHHVRTTINEKKTTFISYPQEVG